MLQYLALNGDLGWFFLKKTQSGGMSGRIKWVRFVVRLFSKRAFEAEGFKPYSINGQKMFK